MICADLPGVLWENDLGAKVYSCWASRPMSTLRN